MTAIWLAGDVLIGMRCDSCFGWMSKIIPDSDPDAADKARAVLTGFGWWFDPVTMRDRCWGCTATLN